MSGQNVLESIIIKVHWSAFAANKSLKNHHSFVINYGHILSVTTIKIYISLAEKDILIISSEFTLLATIKGLTK